MPLSAEPKDLELELIAQADSLEVLLKGSLTVRTSKKVWAPLESWLSGKKFRPTAAAKVVFNLKDLANADLDGLAQLFDWLKRLRDAKFPAEVEEVPAALSSLYNLVAKASQSFIEIAPAKKQGAIEELGGGTYKFLADAKDLITYFGDLTRKLLRTIRRPGTLRFHNLLYIAETAGVNALPIVFVVSFLVGLVIAFQAAMPMRTFGAEVFVADLISLSVTRELGPLMTAIVLAGRSGSAFAAELGSMKAEQEIDALITMGLDPVKFLVVSRVAALTLITPLLALMADLVGVFGGSLVLLSLNYPPIVYWQRALEAIVLSDVLTGLFKAGVFGFIVAAVGCQRGLAVTGGPESVGEATTKSVVTNIVLIAIFDSICAVLFYALKI